MALAQKYRLRSLRPRFQPGKVSKESSPHRPASSDHGSASTNLMSKRFSTGRTDPIELRFGGFGSGVASRMIISLVKPRWGKHKRRS
jgi:hypothetical protein